MQQWHPLLFTMQTDQRTAQGKSWPSQSYASQSEITPNASDLAITDLKDHDVFLGHDWLVRHNPLINWQTGKMIFG